MPTFVNIARDSAPPVLIDAENVTYVSFRKDGREGYVMGREGLLFSADAKNDWQADLSKLAPAMQAAGFAMIPSVARAYDSQQDDTAVALLSPAAVAYITYTQENSGSHGVILGVTGLGQFEASMTKAELKAFLDDLSSNGASMLALPPGEAGARWMSQGGLLVAPEKIARISCDGMSNQLNVFFDGCGMLDIQVPNVDMSRLMKQLKVENPGKDFDDLSAEAYVRRAAEERAAVSQLGKKLADANGTLTAVEGASRPEWLRLQDVFRVYTYDETDPKHRRDRGCFDMIVEYKPDKPHRFGEHARLSFNTAAERQQAVEKVFLKGGEKKVRPPGL